MAGWSLLAGDPLVWVAVTVIRATLVLSGALVLAGLLRRASASVHHALWTVTLAALLALPAMPLVVPELPVPVPDGRLAEALTGAIGVREEGPPRPAESLAPEPAESVALEPAVGGALFSGAPAGPERLLVDSEAANPTPATPPSSPTTGWPFLIWLLGAAALGASLGLGLWRSKRLCRAARPARDQEWLRELHAARAAVGMRRPVSLRFSLAVRTGMAGGLVRSIVLLPETAREWRPDRRQVVLLRELIHLRRLDPFRKLLGRVALTLYWFHPLAWWATRSAALAREEACDEAVVALGHRPSTYARHLLDLADPARLPMPALARIDRPPLEKRIMRLLRCRSISSPRTVALAVALALGWVFVVAALTPAPRGDAAEPLAAQDTVAPPPPPVHEPLPPATEPPPPAAREPSSPAKEPRPEPAADEPPPAPAEPPPSRAEIPGAEASVPVEPAPLPPGAPVTRLASQDPATGCRPRADGPDFADGADFLGVRGTEVAIGGSEGWFIQRSLDGAMLCLRAHGTGDLEALGTAAGRLPEGSWIVLAARGEGFLQRLEIVPGPSGPEHRWFVDGEARPFDDEARAWRDAMLDVMGTAAEMSAVRGQEARLRGEIARARGEETRARGEIAELRGEGARLRGEIARGVGQEATLRGEAARLRGEDAHLRGQIARERSGAARLLRESRELEASLSAMERALQTAESEEVRRRVTIAIEELERVLDEMQERLDSVRVGAITQETRARLAEVEGRNREEVAALEERIRSLDTEERTREIRARLERGEAENAARIRELERAIEGLDVSGTVAEIQSRIDALDTDERLRELGARLERAETRLLELLRGMR